MYYVGRVDLGLFGSREAACQAQGARQNALGGDYTLEFSSVTSGGGCQFKNYYKDGTYFGIIGSGSATPYTVPSCPSGQVHQEGGTGNCVTPPPKPCDTPAGGSVSWNQKTGHSASADAEQGDGAPGPIPASSPTCGVTGAKPERCWSVPASDGGQDFFCKFSGTSNGQAVPSGGPADSGAPPAGATPTNAPPTKADPSGKCPGGMTQGGVSADGMAVCVGSGTNPTGANGGAPTDARPTSSTTTKTTDAAGNKVTTTTGTRDNGDGSKTTTKTTETEAPDGSKSSTTTTTTGLTPGGKQGQPDKPDNDFCRVHPELNMCRNSSIAGQCGQITCMGDAIQCATLREAATIQCRQKEEEDALKASPLHALGQAAANGNDPEKGTLPAPGNGQTVDVSALNADGWLGGGAPPEDVSVEFMGQSIVIPFSKAASALVILRYALMVAAALVSFRILSGAVLGS
jgi:hypothetical protein